MGRCNGCNGECGDWCKDNLTPENERVSDSAQAAGSVFDQFVKADFQALWEKVGFDFHKAECDDCEGILTVFATPDGDMHIGLRPTEHGQNLMPSFRARTVGGGGQNCRVRKALMLLALAIVEDIEEPNDKMSLKKGAKDGLVE